MIWGFFPWDLKAWVFRGIPGMDRSPDYHKRQCCLVFFWFVVKHQMFQVYLCSHALEHPDLQGYPDHHTIRSDLPFLLPIDEISTIQHRIWDTLMIHYHQLSQEYEPKEHNDSHLSMPNRC